MSMKDKKREIISRKKSTMKVLGDNIREELRYSIHHMPVQNWTEKCNV